MTHIEIDTYVTFPNDSESADWTAIPLHVAANTRRINSDELPFGSLQLKANGNVLIAKNEFEEMVHMRLYMLYRFALATSRNEHDEFTFQVNRGGISWERVDAKHLKLIVRRHERIKRPDVVMQAIVDQRDFIVAVADALGSLDDLFVKMYGPARTYDPLFGHEGRREVEQALGRIDAQRAGLEPPPAECSACGSDGDSLMKR